jgi:hypothetical protein
MGLFDFFRKKPAAKEADWIHRLPAAMVQGMLHEIKSNPQACSLDEIPQGSGLFGRVATNPVPVYGIPSNETYLHRLRNSAGERLRWRRMGSINVANIVSKVDEYEIFDYQGNVVAHVYISPYHWKTSDKPVHGFTIREADLF